MLLVVAGFPAAFVSVLFGSSLLIEVIFSLDGLGLLGFEAALNRDYPVMFGTLYFFSLLGLLMNIIGYIMYTIVAQRIDFESREVTHGRRSCSRPPARHGNDRKSTRLNYSHKCASRMPESD